MNPKNIQKAREMIAHGREANANGLPLLAAQFLRIARAHLRAARAG